MLPESTAKVLSKLLTKIASKNIPWLLMGSAGLALQGVAVTVSDIDIETTKEGVYSLSTILTDYVVEEPHEFENETFKATYAKLYIDGIDVELIGDFQNKKLSTPTNFKERYHAKAATIFKSWIVYSPNLKSDYAAYKEFGKLEKAKKIKERLEQLKIF